MSMIKKTTLTIKNNTNVRLSNQLKFYKNDSVTIYFEIEEYNFELKNYSKMSPLSAIAFIETPDGKDTVNTTITDGNLICFNLTSRYTKDVGIFKMQLVVRDKDGCQSAIPSFEFEVRDLINDAVLLVDGNGNVIVTDDGEPLVAFGESFYRISDLNEVENISDEAYIMITQDGTSYKAKLNSIGGSSLDVDLSNYFNKEEVLGMVNNLSDRIEAKVDSTYVKQEIDKALNNINLSEYYTKDEMDTSLSSKSDINHTHTSNEITDLTVPTKLSDLENDSGFLTEIPLEYVTDTELNAKGYLTEHQDISGLATKSELHSHDNKSVLDTITQEMVDKWNNNESSSPSTSEEVVILEYNFTIQESESNGYGVEKLLASGSNVIIQSGTNYNYYFVKDNGNSSSLIVYLATNNEDGTRSDVQVTLNGSNNIVKYVPSKNILSFDMWATGDYGSFTLKIASGGSSESDNIKSNNGLSFSIIGDSYSTYENWIPSGNSTKYPTGDVTDVKLTWWWKLANESGMNLLINDSYSGSTICGTGYSGVDCLNTNSFIARAKANLGENNVMKSKPNIIFILGGTNDTWASSPLGTPKYSGWTDDDLYSTLPAFSYLINYLQTWNSGCRIINIMNDMYISQDMIDGMTTICNYYGVENVSLGQIDVSDNHPTVNGMEQIKNKILEKLDYISSSAVLLPNGVGVWIGTQSEYDAISSKSSTTIYMIKR